MFGDIQQDKRNEDFLRAAKEGNVEGMRAALEAGAELECVTQNTIENIAHGSTALHIAVLCDKFEAVKFLLDETDFDVNTLARFVGTALHIAVERENINILKLLLNKDGIDVNKKNQLGKKPFESEVGVDLKAILKGYGIDVDVKGASGGKAFRNVKNCKKKDEVNIRFLTAASRGEVERMKAALEAGAELNYHNPKGRQTALYLAAQNGHKEAVKFLLSQEGIDVNAQCGYEMWTALHVAMRNDDTEVLQCLLDNPDINVNIKNQKGETPLDVAMNWGVSIKAIKVLIKRSALVIEEKTRNTLLSTAVEHDETDILSFLISKGIDLAKKDSQGDTKLHWAAMYNSKNAMKFLITNGVDVNASNPKQETPLHWIAKSNNCDKEGVEILLAAGGNPCLVDKDSNKPSDLCNITEVKELLQSYEKHFIMMESYGFLAAPILPHLLLRFIGVDDYRVHGGLVAAGVLASVMSNRLNAEQFKAAALSVVAHGVLVFASQNEEWRAACRLSAFAIECLAAYVSHRPYDFIALQARTADTGI